MTDVYRKNTKTRFLNEEVTEIAKKAILYPGMGPKSLSVLTNAMLAKTESPLCDRCDLPV